MKRLKIISALVLAVMMVAVMGLAYAESTALSSGEVGGFYSGNVDNPQVQNKSVIIQKEITAYNPDEQYVYGPVITYNYIIESAAGNELVQITDQPEDHTSGVATVTTALGADAIQSGSPTPTLTGTNTNVIAWTNADILEADDEGKANIKNLTVDFSDVIFTRPGVYRFKITESTTYTNTGVTDGDISTVRYLDVYVMRSSNFDATHDGTTGHEYVANDWAIYGYVCISPESVASNAGGTTAVTPSTKKTNGFVAVPESSSGAGDGVKADEYYTYNFTITKDLVGDNTMINHQFPMTVAFSGGPTGNFQLIAEKDASYSSLTITGNVSTDKTVNGTALAADTILKVGNPGALASFANAGSPKVADGNTATGTTAGYIKYIGIPNTTTVTVTETNDNIGTTYTATVKEDDTTNDGTALAAVALTDSTGTLAAENASASIDKDETATREAAYAGTAGSLAKNVQIEFTNTLAIISPTGYAIRLAPYLAMLVAGIALFVIFKVRRRKQTNEE